MPIYLEAPEFVDEVPAPGHGRGRVGQLKAAAEQLIADPGVYAILATAEPGESISSRASDMKKWQYDNGSFDACVRTVDGEQRLYAAFIPSKATKVTRINNRRRAA